MNLSKILIYLNEELKDIPANSENIHYTNVSNLYQILLSGKLEGGYYSISTHKNKKGAPELCTIRKRNRSLSSSEMYSLSQNASSVKIDLFTKRILSSVRGAKKAAIAEIPQFGNYNLNNIKKEFKKRYEFDCPIFVDKNKDELSGFNLHLAEKGDSRFTSNPIYIKAKKFCKERGFLEDYSILREIIYVNSVATSYYKYLRERETEERFILPKAIPVDPKYMRIQFLDSWTNEVDEEEVSKKEAEDFLNLLAKYKGCFVQDENFKKLEKFLKRQSR